MRAMLIAVILLLAGCADPTPTTEEPTFVADEELQATADTGIIRGVIVDTTINPIADATITIASLGISTTSKADGSFGFSDLEPGIYFLDADAVGFSAVQAQASVEAGVDKPPVVRIALERLASEDPIFEVSKYKANLRCGLAIPRNPVGIGAFGCSLVRGTEEIVGENNAELLLLERIPDFLHVDMFWRSTQPAGDSLTLDIAHCCDNHDIADNSSTFGPSPLAGWATKAEMLEHADNWLEAGIEIRVFPAGNEDVMGATGERVGFVLEQNIEWFTSQFWNFLPDEGWTYINDGNPLG